MLPEGRTTLYVRRRPIRDSRSTFLRESAQALAAPKALCRSKSWPDASWLRAG